MVAVKSIADKTLKLERLPRANGARQHSSPPALDQVAKDQIHGQWRRGVSVEMLSQRFGRSPAAVNRVINEVRARRILGQKLEYMDDPSFDEPGAAGMILAPAPTGGTGAAGAERPAPPGLPPYLASLYGAPLLSSEQEAHLFRKMNYLKYQAAKIRESLDPARARAADLDEIERLQKEALDVKNQIISANLRLVVSIARKRVGPSTNFFELVSDGNVSLIRAVEKFDFSRGFKFSTYASWAIIKNFARSLGEERSRHDRFVTGYEELFAAAADHRSSEHDYENDYRRDQNAVSELLGKLDDRERRILVSRYGIGGARELTLQQLGKELGISKERVRQLEWRAETKLRGFART